MLSPIQRYRSAQHYLERLLTATDLPREYCYTWQAMAPTPLLPGISIKFWKRNPLTRTVWVSHNERWWADAPYPSMPDDPPPWNDATDFDTWARAHGSPAPWLKDAHHVFPCSLGHLPEIRACPLCGTPLTAITEDQHDLNRRMRDIYRRVIQVWSERSFRLYRQEYHLPTREELTGRLHLDHMFSIHQGFLSGIPEEVIAHPGNLQPLTPSQNSAKGPNCAISETELYDRYSAFINRHPEWLDAIHQRLATGGWPRSPNAIAPQYDSPAHRLANLNKQLDAVKPLWDQGWTNAEIAAHLGWTPSTLTGRLQTHKKLDPESWTYQRPSRGKNRRRS